MGWNRKCQLNFARGSVTENIGVNYVPNGKQRIISNNWMLIESKMFEHT